VIATRIGVIGGGQLGMMLTEAATPLGLDVTVLDQPGCPATYAGAHLVPGSITDADRIQELARGVDVVTFEIEHVNAEALLEIEADGVTIHPSPRSLITIKDKLAQKTFLRGHGIPTADFLTVDGEADLYAAAMRFGYPFLVKTRHGGFDGRGNAVVTAPDDFADTIWKLGGEALYAERFVPFAKELAVMVARGTTGEIAIYPVVETVHEESVLRLVLAPAPLDPSLAQQAETLARDVMRHLHGAGVFGIEMFLTQDGEILINEIAPRVHNSGHYTIEACATSQFAQHLLAITGRALGSSAMTHPAAVTINILGERSGVADPQGTEEAETLGVTAVHWYHKREVRPLRKMGHITVTGDRVEQCLETADAARALVSV
jgi:5-(carboxyamino)imidazole ribonucleotide synthase